MANDLRHKTEMLRYWLGVSWFKVTGPFHRLWSFCLWLWAVTKGVTKAFCVWVWELHLRAKALYIKLIFIYMLHPMKLGKYAQHAARPARVERFPDATVPDSKLPSIAIVTPSYNQANYVGRTIKSVLSQNYPHLQYAVLDGGSKDGSREIIEAFRPQLAYAVSEPDKGQADAVTRGFEKVEGEIMAYLNSDDMLMPGMLRFVGAYFAAHPEVDAVYGHRVVVDADDAEIGRWVLPHHCPETLRYMDYVPQETLFWRRSIYEKAGGVDPSFGFALDWDLLLRFMHAGAVIRRLPYYMAYFRSHGEQKSHALIDSVGARESRRLMDREHAGTFNKKLHDRLYYRCWRQSVIHAVLLDWGIRR